VRACVVALDTLNPIKYGLKLFNMGKENAIYEPLKTPPKSSMWGKYKREEREEELPYCHYSNSAPLMAYKSKRFRKRILGNGGSDT